MAQQTGFQDYNRLSIQAGQVLDITTGTLGSDPMSPRLDAGGFGYVNISLSGGLGSNDAYRVSVQWYADAAKVQLLSQQNISLLGPEQQFQVVAIGRWFTVGITFFAGTSTDVVTMVILGSNVFSPRLQSQIDSNPYIYVNQVVNATTSLNFDGILTVPGECTWAVASATNSTWVAALAYYEIGSGAYLNFAFMYGSTKGLSGIERVTLPYAPTRMIVNNASAVGQTFQCSLIPTAV